MNGLKSTLITLLLPCLLSAQNYLSEEKEIEIKTSESYYWDECSGFDAAAARQCAFTSLRDRIIEDAVNQTIKQEEVLKAIDMGAHFDNLQQKGKIKILAWIAKDSVFVTTQKPIMKMQAETKPQQTPPVIQQPPVTEEEPSTPVLVPTLTPVPVATDNPVLKELIECKNFKDVKRVATMNGLVKGTIGRGSEGFSNPEKCIIAVFTGDGTLSALLDVGSNSRTDMLSGKTVQNPEQYYKGDEYNLWYLQQKE